LSTPLSATRVIGSTLLGKETEQYGCGNGSVFDTISVAEASAALLPALVCKSPAWIVLV
jgi:hypothetical protein